MILGSRKYHHFLRASSNLAFIVGFLKVSFLKFVLEIGDIDILATSELQLLFICDGVLGCVDQEHNQRLESATRRTFQKSFLSLRLHRQWLFP